MVAGGYRAIDSMRLEKGLRVWGADITPDETPYEARGRLLREARQGGRLHRPRGARRGKGAGPAHGGSAASPSPTRARSALGNEPVRIGGEICGRVTSGGYGYTVGRSIAYAYLPPEHAEPGTGVEVEIFGRWVEGEVAAEPLFDPEGRADQGLRLALPYGARSRAGRPYVIGRTAVRDDQRRLARASLRQACDAPMHVSPATWAPVQLPIMAAAKVTSDPRRRPEDHRYLRIGVGAPGLAAAAKRHPPSGRGGGRRGARRRRRAGRAACCNGSTSSAGGETE